MNFDVDGAGTAVLVAVTGVFWFFTFGSGMSPTTTEMLVVVGFTALTLTKTGTIALGTSAEEPAPDESGPTPATDGGERRDDA
ncbi:hypothetical protein [Halorubrum kocurii]|uniref:Uncharacterized protein n=1 Tax=Halorubrum kocurii JCM 14978 TaxID=1230456 RepID=M0NPS1_9EURY|nr:hypothetical protein [Halorubrum kocurii]EMA59932.1 hypothetical protein C468_14108 [Halorubrum kocurii JCM 14978]